MRVKPPPCVHGGRTSTVRTWRSNLHRAAQTTVYATDTEGTTIPEDGGLISIKHSACCPASIDATLTRGSCDIWGIHGYHGNRKLFLTQSFLHFFLF